jgi:hypothetical protein
MAVSVCRSLLFTTNRSNWLSHTNINLKFYLAIDLFIRLLVCSAIDLNLWSFYSWVGGCAWWYDACLLQDFKDSPSIFFASLVVYVYMYNRSRHANMKIATFRYVTAITSSLTTHIYTHILIMMQLFRFIQPATR